MSGSTMRAGVLHEFNKPLLVESVPMPKMGETDALVRIKASGICHSDLHIYHGREAGKMPVILGHECAGIVESVGSRVTNAKVGDRVIVDYRLTCGDCYYCSIGRSNICDSAVDIGFDLDGAYAQFIAVPSRQLTPLPREISFEQGAIIGCAVVTAYHATRVAEFRPGNTVAIVGLGGIGYHILKFVRAFGASTIFAVDVDDRKLVRAAKLGATTINPAVEPAERQIKRLTNGQGVDVAFEAIGNPRTIETMIKTVGRAGKAVIVGVCGEKIEITPWQDLMMNPVTGNSGKEVQVRTTIDHVRTDLGDVIKAVLEKKIDLSDSITHRVSLEDCNRGLEILEKKIGDPMRVVMMVD